jgi:flavin reductase (DIM6/NTAB) family NADH-FMN oxidoreductase RutF
MQKQFSLEDILAMERFYRRDFMNTISGYRSCHLLGTLSYKKVPNLGLFNSITHVGATPPHLGFIMRPLTVPRQTYHNIKAQGYFTLNQVTEELMHQAHQASAKYEPDHSEFEAVGLKPQYTATHPAPYVAESPIKLGLEFAEEHHIQANGAIFVIGKIVEVIIDEALIAEDGHIMLEKAGILSVVGLDSYYKPELIDRLDYPRP